jgi:hypothetical protein
MKTFVGDGLEIFITADGSPTLTLTREDGYAEKMHHSGGALAESVYIYEYALLQSLEIEAEPRVLSLGLGLGYNELLAIAALRNRDFKIWSFELRDDLRAGFRDWTRGGAEGLSAVFASAAETVAGHSGLAASELRSLASAALESGRLELRGPFPQDIAGVLDCTCVFFDAFSRKMDPHLWSEAETEAALKPMLAPSAIVATYAATGALNRILKNLGFTLQERPGFQGKRESTFATRGV